MMLYVPVSTTSPPRFLALLREQRYRRHFLKADAKQAIVVIALLAVALVAIVRNDYVLFGTSTVFFTLLAIRCVFVIITLASIAMLQRAKWPRQLDRATALWSLAFGAMMFHAFVTRLPTGEYVGPLLGQGVILCVLFFAMRGALWDRVVVGLILVAGSFLIAWNPQAALTSSARVTVPIAILVLFGVGISSARSFHEQRRTRFEAERKEKHARQLLDVKVHELAIEKERAEAMSRARTAFLAAMSHEFRTPMNAVLGFSELLLQDDLDVPRQEKVVAIRDSARGLLVLLNDVLDFAKIDADKLMLSPAPFDLYALAESVVDMMQSVVGSKPVELLLEISPDVPNTVVGDDARLRQVLVNLVSNAIKFTERGAVKLRITSRPFEKDEHDITVCVEDTGIGMTHDVMVRLFQVFEQGDRGITRRYGGTGLGLAISKRIVQAMGGDILVESEPGSGSVFSFSVRLTATKQQPATRHEVVVGTSRTSLSILVVDDQSLNRRLAQAMLQKLGYHPDLASNGQEAIVAAEKKDYDVVFMDLQMPDMSGIEATERITKMLEGKPMPQIVAMTASVFEEDRVACRNVGMVDFVSKPMDIGQLQATLARMSVQKNVQPLPNTLAAALDPKPLEQLRQLAAVDEPGFFVSLCNDFIADSASSVNRIASAFEQGDAAGVEMAAHSLKSSSASLGAVDMSNLCGRIEAAARAQDMSAIGGWIDELLAEVPRVERALRIEMARAPRTVAA